MINNVKIFLERLRSLAKLDDDSILQEELKGIRIEDLAEAFQRISVEDGLELLFKFESSIAIQVLIELPSETAKQYYNELSDDILAKYLEFLPVNDILEMEEDLGAERFSALLTALPRKEAIEIHRLMAYPEASVGRIMSEDFVKADPDSTMIDIINTIREEPPENFETVDIIYVVSEDEHLVGVLTLHQVLRAAPEQSARSVMNSDVIAAHPAISSEDAARLLSKYGFPALPITDERGHMLGILVDEDAYSILDEADTEDVLKMGGVSGEADAYLSLGIFQLAKRRIPWMAILFIAQIFTGTVLKFYGHAGETLSIDPVLYFIPLLTGAGGNSGAQTTTTITRALAIGEIKPSDAFLILSREFLTSLIIGLTLGVVGYCQANYIWHAGFSLSLVVGLALPCIILWSATVGSLLPLAAKKIGLDPAVLCAPFITTFVDATGLIIYFQLYMHIV